MRHKAIWVFVACGLGAALALAAFVSPFASKAPDGLDKFAEDHNIAEPAAKAWTHAPLAEYKLAVVENESVSTALSGIAGTLIVFGAAFGLAKLASARKARQAERPL